MVIRITAQDADMTEVKMALQRAVNDPAISFELDEGEGGFRSVDPPTLVAVIAAGGATLGALITGVLAIRAGRVSQYIVIRGSSGRVLKIPADTPAEEIDELVRRARDIDVTQIDL